MTTDNEIHPELTERDLEPVRDLIEDVRQHEKKREEEAELFVAAVTWLNAFSSFKRLRLRHGLPHGASSKLFYGAIVSDLKTTGKLLLGCHQESIFSLDRLPVGRKNFEACVRELSCDDVILDMGYLDDEAPEEMKQVAALLGG